MKTLDEVIIALEVCTYGYCSHPKHGDCPYLDERNDCDIRQRKLDALHYLRNYRENQHAYEEGNRKAEEARERYLEAVKNCELAENKYRKLWKETSQNSADTSQITCPKCHSEFVILPEANNPLTWHELRQMEGKPVWVESSDSFNRRRWMFVGEWFDDDEMRLFDMGYDYPDYVSKNGYESGTWQAYKKERK